MFSYTFANEIANNLITELTHECESLPDGKAGIQIVGSLRRRKQSVNDIDIIVIPKFELIKDDTLFGEPVKENILDRKLSQLCLDGILILEANGAKIKRFSQKINNVMVPIDLYIASELTWWTLLLIRTGSREHNIRLASKALNQSMHLKADGSGLLTSDNKLIKINSEEEIFQHLDLQFLPPEERN
jgi:DNA polymerase/3'-5' exonuclease PolX